MTARFQHRVALITGGSSGIGRATALAFAREGATVVIAARNPEAGTEVVREITASVNTPVRFTPTDVTSSADCQALVSSVMDSFGRLDVLVNNAGVIVREKTVVDTTPEEWDLTFDVNVKGTYLMSRAAIPAMTATIKGDELSGRSGPVEEDDGAGTAVPSSGVERGTSSLGAAIVNNASYLGVVGGRGVAAYSAAKGAVVNLTRAMALDHAGDGIRVNCVAPGSVETPMLRQEWEEMGGEARVRHLFEGKHPMGRISQPEEIARVILFLASPEASFINGACIPVDAGITAG
jgi:NAD(P)-dependent dehydrogenase (short-subunit alcohol dehydrogenase family)